MSTLFLAHVGPHGADPLTLAIEAISAICAVIYYGPLVRAYFSGRFQK